MIVRTIHGIMRFSVQKNLLPILLVGLWTFASDSTFAADVLRGGEVYVANCESCHGISGASIMPNVPSFNQGDGLMQPDLALLTSIRNGKNTMPAYRGILSDRDILDVIAYIRTLN